MFNFFNFILRCCNSLQFGIDFGFQTILPTKLETKSVCFVFKWIRSPPFHRNRSIVNWVLAEWWTVFYSIVFVRNVLKYLFVAIQSCTVHVSVLNDKPKTFTLFTLPIMLFLTKMKISVQCHFFVWYYWKLIVKPKFIDTSIVPWNENLIYWTLWTKTS
jgi:hypothetical protein